MGIVLHIGRSMFIVLEGCNGVGKTTIASMLSEELKNVLLTSEPYKISERTRGVGAFFKDRQQHITKVIKPALSKGKTVICSRYIPSTEVYQGIPKKEIIDIHRNTFQEELLMPNKLIFLHDSYENIYKRLQAREFCPRADLQEIYEKYEEIYSSYNCLVTPVNQYTLKHIKEYIKAE